MNQRCLICQQALPLDGRGVTQVSMGGRGLFNVHQDRCSEVVFSSTRAVGYLAMHQGRKFLRRKLPMVSAFVEGYARVKRDERLMP